MRIHTYIARLRGGVQTLRGRRARRRWHLGREIGDAEWLHTGEDAGGVL